MSAPRIAIVGRPNVGKSSLLNMIAGDKVSIVDPTPGVTRDRVSVVVDLPAPDDKGPVRSVQFTDTGGYGVYTAEGQRFDDVGADLSSLTKDIEFQIGEAVQNADLVLFAVDTQAGITPQDEEIARMLREQKFGREAAKRRSDGATKGEAPRRVPVRVVATKCDGPKWEAHALEISGLGFGEPLMCSAKNNYMRRDFVETLYTLLPPPEPDEATRLPPADLMLAIIGKRNAGKSSLVNALAGEERMIVSEIAGTTRDAVDVRFEMDGRSLVAIDTAGLRRKKSFAGRVEWFAFDRAKRAIERADVVLFMIDAEVPISQVDEQLGALVQKAFKPCILVVNKWDLADGQKGKDGTPVTPEKYEAYLRKDLNGLDYAPISFMSAAEGINIRETIDLAFDHHQQATQRITTGILNRLVRGIIETRQPTSKSGTRVKVLYIAQVSVSPPTIVLVVNHPELFSPGYQRFLMNRFREELPFTEVPIKLVIRGRRPKDAGDKVLAAPTDGAEEAEVEFPAEPEAYFEEETQEEEA
jgi:GTP-binding protein